MMDMRGLPPETIASCKKLEMYYTSQTQHNECYLSRDKQLHQSQGARVFQHVAQAAFQTRPEKVRPAAQIMTLEELRVKHRQAAVQAEANRASAPPPPADEDPDAEDGSGSAAPVAAPKSRAFGIVVPQLAKATAKSAARKAKAKAAAAAAGGTLGSSPAPGGTSSEPGLVRTAVETAEDDRSESTAGNGNRSKQAILVRLDEDMRRVAERHMNNHAAGSVKSLESLDPLRYLLSLSIALTSVRHSGRVSHIATVC